MKSRAKDRSPISLRRQAEGQLQDKPPAGRLPQAKDTGRLVHELQVHQIELELKNEELLESQAETQAALKRYARLYDHAPVAYFTLDLLGNIRQHNRAGAGLLGEEDTNLVGKSFLQFVNDRDRSAFRGFLARIFARGAKASCELALTMPGKPQQDSFAQIEAVPDPSGQTVSAIALDITEKKRINEELIRSNQELQQFAYIAAHDLQTPLRSIGGFAQLLQRDYGNRLGTEADSWISQIVRYAERMQALINAVLGYARIDSQGASFEAVDLGRVCDEFLESAAATLAAEEATVTRSDLPTVVGDRLQLAQVLQNLIDNGIKYRGSEPPRVHLSARREDQEWVISVHDNGIGIAGKHHGQIFEIFQRLHSQHAYPGTGIGLAICRRIVQRHGGRIWLDSEPGQGSVFHFTLPDRSP